MLREVIVDGRNLGSITTLSRDGYYARYPRVGVALMPGQDLHYLQSRSEGTCFVRIGGRVIEADTCPVFDEADFRLLTEAVTEWWVQVEVDGHRGWAVVDGKQLRVVERTF